MMLGSKLYIDFTDSSQFASSMEKLTVELGRVGVFTSSDSRSNTGIDTAVTTTQKTSSNLKHWTEEEIQSWADDNAVPLDEVIFFEGVESF